MRYGSKFKKYRMVPFLKSQNFSMPKKCAKKKNGPPESRPFLPVYASKSNPVTCQVFRPAPVPESVHAKRIPK